MLDTATITIAGVTLIGGVGALLGLFYRVGKGRGRSAEESESVNDRLDRLEDHMDSRFDDVDTRIETLRDRVDENHQQILSLVEGDQPSTRHPEPYDDGE